MEIRKMGILLIVLLALAVSIRIWWDWQATPQIEPVPETRAQQRFQETEKSLKGAALDMCPGGLFLLILAAIVLWRR